MSSRAELRVTVQGAESVFPLEVARATVGRDAENSLCLADSVVSRFHAEFLTLGDDVLLRDLGSTNGTFVNGERIAEQILAPGDVIRLGKAGPELVFVQAEDGEPTTDLEERRERPTTGLIESLSGKLGLPGADPVEEANLRSVLAEAHLARGHLDDALEVLGPFEDTATLDRLPPTDQAAISLVLGRVRTELKQYDRALELLRGALSYAERAGDDVLKCSAQAAIGRALTGTGELLIARDALHRAMLGARRAGNIRLRADIHLALGRLDWKEGDLDGARYNWRRAGSLAERTTDELLQAKVSLQMAFVLYAEGNLKDAAPAFENSIKQLEAIGNVSLLLKAYSNLSRILTRLGLWSATERLLVDRLRLARQKGVAKAEAVALTDLAELRLLQGNLAAASNVIQSAVEKHTTVYARTQRILGRIAVAQGRTTEAITALERGLEAAAKKGSLEEQILSELELAAIFVEARQYGRARERLRHVESITSLDPALYLTARSLYTWGRLHAAEDQLSEANRNMSQALSIFQTIGDPFRTGLCHVEIATIRTRMGRPASARAHYEEAERIFSRLGAAGELGAIQARLRSGAFDHVEPAMTRTLSMTAPLSMALLKPVTFEQLEVASGPRRILVAEADQGLANLLVRGLEVENYSVDCVPDGRAALRRVESSPSRYDMLVLDALLEHQSGFDVCREVRKRKLEMPVVLLGGRQGVEDKIEALQAGADDFISKRAMVFEELLAKMEALLR